MLKSYTIEGRCMHVNYQKQCTASSIIMGARLVIIRQCVVSHLKRAALLSVHLTVLPCPIHADIVWLETVEGQQPDHVL